MSSRSYVRRVGGTCAQQTSGPLFDSGWTLTRLPSATDLPTVSGALASMIQRVADPELPSVAGRSTVLRIEHRGSVARQQ